MLRVTFPDRIQATLLLKMTWGSLGLLLRRQGLGGGPSAAGHVPDRVRLQPVVHVLLDGPVPFFRLLGGLGLLLPLEHRGRRGQHPPLDHPPCDREVGRPVRLPFEGLGARIAPRPSVKLRLAALLHHVRQLVGDEAQSFGRPGTIAATAQHDLPAARERMRAHGVGGAGGRVVMVDPHPAEVVAQPGLQHGANRGVERLSGGAQDLAHMPPAVSSGRAEQPRPRGIAFGLRPSADSGSIYHDRRRTAATSGGL